MRYISYIPKRIPAGQVLYTTTFADKTLCTRRALTGSGAGFNPWMIKSHR